MTTRQQDFTTLTAGCGHTTIVRLSLDAERAANEIIQLTTGVCGTCAKAAHQSTRGILWSDVNGSRWWSSPPTRTEP
jgi:hypothetical protein